jgi:hypothetical protein
MTSTYNCNFDALEECGKVKHFIISDNLVISFNCLCTLANAVTSPAAKVIDNTTVTMYRTTKKRITT